MNDNLASKYLLLLFIVVAVVAFLGEQDKLIGGMLMGDAIIETMGFPQ